MSDIVPLSRAEMTEIVDILEYHPEVTQNEIDALVEAWTHEQKPDEKISRVVWALRDAGAYRHKKAVRHWVSDL